MRLIRRESRNFTRRTVDYTIPVSNPSRLGRRNPFDRMSHPTDLRRAKRSTSR